MKGMKKNIFSKRPSLVEVTLKFEDGVDRNSGRTYELVDASTYHQKHDYESIKIDSDNGIRLTAS